MLAKLKQTRIRDTKQPTPSCFSFLFEGKEYFFFLLWPQNLSYSWSEINEYARVKASYWTFPSDFFRQAFYYYTFFFYTFIFKCYYKMCVIFYIKKGSTSITDVTTLDILCKSQCLNLFIISIICGVYYTIMSSTHIGWIIWLERHYWNKKLLFCWNYEFWSC